MWYRLAAQHKYLNEPHSKDIPEGMARRVHYTGSNELLPKLESEGILVNNSESYKSGDPKAVWSNPSTPESYKNFQHKPLVEFYADPEKIIGDQYSYDDVKPEQILGTYPTFHRNLNYIMKNFGVEGGIKKIEELGYDKPDSDNPNYYQVYLVLKEIQRKEDWAERNKVERDEDKYVFYHASRIDLPYLRKGSLLETTPEEARKWGNENTRNDRRKRLNVYKVIIDLEDFEIGTMWAITNKDLKVTKAG
jgi:hypothetical protein